MRITIHHALRAIITSVVVLISVFALSASAGAATYDVAVTVDASQSIEVLPDIFKSGGTWLAYDTGNPYIFDQFLDETKSGPLWTDQIFTPWDVTAATSIKDFKQRVVDYNGGYLKKFIDKAKKYGDPIFISLWGWTIPRWLSPRTICDKQEYYIALPDGSQNPNGICVPGEDIYGLRFTFDWVGVGHASFPTDLKPIQDMVKFVVRFAREDSFYDADLGRTVQGLGIRNLGGFYGWETDNFAFLNEDEMLRMFEAVVAAARSVAPDIKIAGIGPGGYLNANKNCLWGTGNDTVIFNGKTYTRQFISSSISARIS